MSVRTILAENLPRAFHWLQAKRIYPIAREAPDVRRATDRDERRGYQVRILGHFEAQGFKEPAFRLTEDAPSSVVVDLLKQYSTDFCASVPIAVFDVADVKLWGEFGVHHSPSGNFLEVYCNSTALDNPKYEIPRNILRYRSVSHHIDTGIYFAPAWYHNHYHWLIDIVPRLLSVQLELNEGLPVLVPPSLRPVQLDILQKCLSHLGARTDRILPLEKGITKVRRLIMPTMRNHSLDVNDESRTLLRSALMTGNASPSRRIFVSRRDAPNRSIANEDEIVALLLERNFEVVTLSSLSLDEQISLFASASCVVPHHGAGLTNLLFSSPGTKVIEFFQEGHFAPCFARLAQVGQMPYGLLVGGRAGHHTQVDPGRLNALLDQAEL